jgi:hypothetical protein
MADYQADRKHLVTAVAASLQEKFGDSFAELSVHQQIREAVSTFPGLLQSCEIEIIIRLVSGSRPSHTMIANTLSRAKKRGLLYSPFKGVWGAVPNLTIPDTAESLAVPAPEFDEATLAIEGHLALLDREEQADFDAWESEITNH